MKKIIRNRIILSLAISCIFLISVASTSVLAAPALTTEPATDITETSATLEAAFSMGGQSSVEVWFEFNGGNTPATTYTSSGSHSQEVTGLTPDTEYEYRAVLRYYTGWGWWKVPHYVYGSYETFTTSSSGPDITPPEVTILNPQDGATVSGTVNINFEATDIHGIATQRILIDSGEVSTDFSYSWDTTGLADGSTHTIRCEATDPSENMGFDEISITVDNTAPAHNPILFVHGIWGNDHDFDTMKARFEADGWDSNLLYSINLPKKSAQVGDNIINAEAIEDYIEDIILIAHPGAKVDLISHSMGGLSTRYYVKYLEGYADVDDFVCLDSPNHGYSGFGGWLVPDMLPTSALITALNDGDETPYGVLPDSGTHVAGTLTWHALYATDSSAVLDGATVDAFPSVDHNGFKTDVTVYETTRDYVTD
ncbi:MAG: Ig-like domain-containing protein [Promethearchaeota archaeon]